MNILADELEHVAASTEPLLPRERMVIHAAVKQLRGNIDIMGAQRREFETKVMELQTRLGVFGKLEGAPGNAEYENTFWRTPDGLYGVQQWNAAWWSWCAARGL